MTCSGRQRLAEQRVVAQVDHAEREVVAGAPRRVEAAEGRGAEGRAGDRGARLPERAGRLFGRGGRGLSPASRECFRRSRAAAASSRSTGTVRSQPRHASVMLWPKTARSPGSHVLAAVLEEALDHDARRCCASPPPPAAPTACATSGCCAGSLPLLAWEQSTMMRGGEARLLERLLGARDRLGVVVRARRAAAQDQVAVGVAARRDDRGDALLGDRQEVVRVGRGADRVDRDLDAAVGAVLEADRHREARGQLAVHLALARARADRAPGDEVGDELRRDRVEELAARRAAQLGEVEQEAPRDAQALVDRGSSRRGAGSLISPFQPTIVRGFSK